MAIGPRIAEGRTAEIFVWGDKHVLKLYRDGFPPDEASREAALHRAVYDSKLNIPAVGDVITVDGRAGIIYERVNGPTMLQVLATKPWQLISLSRLLAELQAAMHSRQATTLPLQRPRLQGKIQRARILAPEMKTAVLALLDSLPDDSVVCHGDFHPANIVLTPRGPVIIDWVDASQGHPLADVARTSLLFRLASLPPDVNPLQRLLIDTLRHLSHAIYLRRYLQLRPVIRTQLAAWEAPIAAARLSEGIMDEEEDLLAVIKAGLLNPAHSL